MSDSKCITCGGALPEGANICGYCAEILKPYSEIIRAWRNKRPVEYKGIKYGCISAVIFRSRASALKGLGRPQIVQVELMSKRTNSVVIADPANVEILKEF